MVSDEYLNKVYEELCFKLFGDKTQTSIIKLDDEVRELLDIVLPNKKQQVAYLEWFKGYYLVVLKANLRVSVDLTNTGCFRHSDSFEGSVRMETICFPELKIDVNYEVNKTGLIVGEENES